MRDHAYGNTVTDDLWREVDQVSARPITDIAHDFTLQAGVPMIAERSAACLGGATGLTLGQDRFIIDPGAKAGSAWRTPVTVRALGAPRAATAVVSAGASTRLRVPGCGAVVLNAGQTAYFRSRYSTEGLRAISARFGELAPDDQLGLINDAASLAFAGQAPMSDFLDLTPVFRTVATDPVVAGTLAGRLESLDEDYRGLPGQAAFRAWARGLLRPMLERIGWREKAGESGNTAILRASLLETLGNLDDPAVLAWARERFAALIADPASLEPSLRRAALRIVAIHADPASWEQVRALGRAARTELERRELFDDLAAPEDPALARRALELALTPEVPRTTGPGMIARAADRHPAMALDFTLARWSEIATRIEPAAQARYLPRLIAGSYDLALIPRLDAFAAAHIPADDRQDVRKAEAEVRYHARLRADGLPQLDAWLKGHGIQ